MDARKKTMITIISVGSLFVIWRVFSLMNPVAPASADATPVAEPPQATGPAAGIGAFEPLDPAVQEAQRRVAEQPWGRDPFDSTRFVAAPKPEDEKPAEKVQETPPPAPTLRFTGVSKTGSQWLAAVDGSIVRVGDTVQTRFKVAAISKTSITLALEGWSFQYELGAKEPVVRRMSEKP